MTRHDTLPSPRILAQEKIATCCVALVGQQGATRSCVSCRDVAWRDPTSGIWAIVNVKTIEVKTKLRRILRLKEIAIGTIQESENMKCPSKVECFNSWFETVIMRFGTDILWKFFGCDFWISKLAN